MPMDGLTIKAMVEELKSTLLNAKIDKTTQPENDELVLLCHAKTGNYKLLFCVNASFARICLTNVSKPSPIVAPAFCMLMRKHLTGGHIKAIRQVGNERIVHITAEGLNDFNEPEEKHLILELMGKHSNLILTDRNGMILDSIKRVNSLMSRVRLVQPGLPYQDPPSQNKADPFTCEAPEAMLTAKALGENYMGLSRQAAEELYAMQERYGLRAGWDRFLAPYRTGTFTPVIIKNESAVTDFFALPQEHLAAAQQYPCNTLSEALDLYFTDRDRQQRIREHSHDLRSKLTLLLDRAEKKRIQQEEKLTECADREKYRIWGELITANIYQIPKGASCVVLPDYYHDMAPTEIPLDPALSPAANAQKYFKHFAKLKTAARLLNDQIAQTERDIDYLTEQSVNLENCETKEDLTDIRQCLTTAGFLKPVKTKQKEQGGKPMHFVSDAGIDIYVGKNNVQNDELTLRFASPDDMWLHTKGIHGSHVIIKSNEPDETTIEQAVLLAAYYSKGRASSSVPVDAAKKRYVKKPAGSLPGKVIYTNQTTYYITPEEEAVQKIKRI